MIKVMIVEDDKLARKGIIASIDWNRYGMKIVAEASNGHTALDYLSEHSIDLLLTDIAMPVMSGMELIREVKQRYPAVQVVVLTMYQTFEYIQESLRLGALDYISKVQLEQDDISGIMENILHRMEHGQDASGKELYQRDGACYAIIQLEKKISPIFSICTKTGLLLHEVSERASAVFIPTNHPFLQDIERLSTFERTLSHQMDEDTMALKLTDGANFKEQTIFQTISAFCEKDLFYSFNPTLQEVSISDLSNETLEENHDYYTYFKQELTSLDWIYDTDRFNSITQMLRKNRLSYTRLYRLLAAIEEAMKTRYNFLTDTYNLQMPESFSHFGQVEDWLTQSAAQIRSAVNSQTLSPYVVECISQAVQIIQQELQDSLFATEVSTRVHLSRSYFCQCFKKILGISFNHYLRKSRVEKAEELLLKSDYSIQIIAEKIGYADEKYFSNLFKKEKGMLPSKFRQTYKVLSQ